jgi:predicted transcriptional regulator
MAVPPRKGSSFAPFLEKMQQYRQRQQTPGGSPLKLLTILVSSGPRPVPELIRESGMGFADFAEALETMQEAGLIALAGQPGQEVVEITPSGERMARLAK